MGTVYLNCSSVDRRGSDCLLLLPDRLECVEGKLFKEISSTNTLKSNKKIFATAKILQFLFRAFLNPDSSSREMKTYVMFVGESFRRKYLQSVHDNSVNSSSDCANTTFDHQHHSLSMWDRDPTASLSLIRTGCRHNYFPQVQGNLRCVYSESSYKCCSRHESAI